MESNSPAEGLLVDHKNQDQRKRESQRESREIRQQSQEPRLDEYLFSYLSCLRAEKPEQSDFAAPVDDQRQQRTGDSHHRDNYSHGLQGVRNGKRAVENSDRLDPQIAV